MTDFTQYEKGYSPCAIQRKYSLTYAQSYELAERLKKTRELELEVRRENAQLKERVSKLEKMQYSYTPEEWNTMLRTLNRTKELLKECNQILIAYEMMAKGEYRKKLRELIAQINQVLGEE